MTQGAHTPLEWQIWHSDGNTSYDSQCPHCNDFQQKATANPAATPQPPPLLGQQEVTPLMIADLEARRAFGMQKYGTPLMVDNGRDHLMDAWQEMLDHMAYFRCALVKRDAHKQQLRAALDQMYAMDDADVAIIADTIAHIWLEM